MEEKDEKKIALRKGRCRNKEERGFSLKSLCIFLHSSVAFCILLCALLAVAVGVCSELNASGQVSHPQNATAQITALPWPSVRRRSDVPQFRASCAHTDKMADSSGPKYFEKT
jgi:hypothetical protein